MAVTAAQLQQLYLAYFGRPADFDGIAYYTTGNWDIWQVAKAFGESPESQSLYGPGFNVSVINAIYQNLFNRDAEPAGLLYWSQQVASGALTAGEAALGILLGAQNADATTVANKLAVAADFTANLDTAPEILAYTGDAAAAAARAFLHTVTADPTTVTTAEASIPTVIATIVDVGGTMGTTVTLTTTTDTFTAPNQTYIDTVNGIIDNAGKATTFSDADKIVGNGHTVVNVTVKDVTGGTPFVQMSDVAKLNLLNAGATTATFDASSWTNVSQVTLSGVSGLYAEVDNLTNDTGLKLKVDGATTGTLDVSNAAIGSAVLNGSVTNSAKNSVGAVAAFGSTGIDIALGKSAAADFTMVQSKTGLGAAVAAKVGDLTAAHVNIDAGVNASFYTISLTNYAQATSAAATVGNVSLGNVAINAATNAGGRMSVSNHAWVSAGKGAATVGNLTTFWNSIKAATSAAATVYYYNSATSTNGNATVGSVSLGGVSQSGVGYIYMSVENSANANGKGAAKAGDMAVGDVTITGVSATASHHLYVYNYAEAQTGAATVGNMSFGNLSLVGSNHNHISAYNSATNTKTGAVTAGNITVGTINMEQTGNNANTVSLYDYAYANGGKGGATSVGSVTIGNVTMSVATGSNYLGMTQSAEDFGTAGGGATVGDLTVGSIDLKQVAAKSDGSNEVYLNRWAYSSKGSATAGNVSIGDVNINVAGITQASATNQVYVYNEAQANGTSGAATVGTLTIGNVTAKTGLSGFVEVSVENWASGATDGSTGRVTVGNVAMTGSKAASMFMYAYNTMTGVGNAGGVTVGNVSIKGDTSAGVASFQAYDYALSGDVSSVSVGNVSLTAKDIALYVTNSAANGAGSTLTVGNVTLKGGNYGGGSTIQNNGSDSVGATTVGAVSMTTLKADTLDLNISATSTGGAVGTLTVGDIGITLANGDTAGNQSHATLDIFTDGGKGASGNIKTGNITVGSTGATTKAALTAPATALVHVTSTDGTVTVGNITVTGGITGTAGGKIVTDNLQVLTTWLTLSGSTMTVGNVDYSGYAAASTIDVHSFAGAGTIKASKGGSTITDNKGVNNIDLSANTTKVDTIIFRDVQSGVKDSGGVITASQTALDTITGFASGDVITLQSGVGGDSDVIQNTPSQTFAQFLVNAEAQIKVAGNSAYVAVIGGNTYVALADSTGKVGEIVEVMGSHTFTWNAGTLVFAS